MGFTKWSNGEHVITSVDFNGMPYTFKCTVDMDTDMSVIWLFITENDETICQNKIIYWHDKDAYVVVDNAIAQLQNCINTYFDTDTVPTTWWDKVMDGLQKYIFEISNGVPTLTKQE